jgi:hypothetical protein
MRTSAASAEAVLRALGSVEISGLIIALCLLGIVFIAIRRAFRTGRSLDIRVTPRSLDLHIGPGNQREILRDYKKLQECEESGNDDFSLKTSDADRERILEQDS